MDHDTQFGPADVQARIGALFSDGQALQEGCRARIVALGAQATDPLVDILEDHTTWDDQSPGAGWAPIHAADILADIADPAALDPMVGVYRQVDPDAILDDALADAIRSYGPAAVDAGLRELRGWDDPFLQRLAYLVSGVDTRQDKALQILLKFFVDHPVPGADLLADYGDPVAIDALEVALDRYIVAGGADTTYRRPVFAIAEAIEALGGQLSAGQQDAVELLKIRRSRSEKAVDDLARKPAPDDHLTYRKPHDLGRNDPCWCGSGQKYKRCHWAQDQR